MLEESNNDNKRHTEVQIYATGKQDLRVLFRIRWLSVTWELHVCSSHALPQQSTVKGTNNKLEIRFVSKYKLLIKNYASFDRSIVNGWMNISTSQITIY
jgi:hypothetical protein